MTTKRYVRLFRSGQNQALRIPAEFEPPGKEAIVWQVRKPSFGRKAPDRIDFRGAKVAVRLHNVYRSRVFRERRDITIAADRIVRVHEDGIECWLDTHLIEIKMRKRPRSEPPAYHAFVSELPKRVLKRFPLLVAYNHSKRPGSPLG